MRTPLNEGHFFLNRNYIETKQFDYYPPGLIAYEFVSSFPWFKEEQIRAYYENKQMFVEMTMPVGHPYIEDFIEDLKYCKYELINKNEKNDSVIMTFRSTAYPDFNKLPEKLYFYALSPERFFQFKEKELYDAEHIHSIVENAYEQNISRSDNIKSYNVYEIPFQYTDAVLVDDETYVAFGSGCFDASKAVLVDNIENFLGI